METARPELSPPKGLDWLSPVTILFAVFALYVPGRIFLRNTFNLSLLWGGDARDERLALALVALFALAVVIGARIVPRQPLFGVRFESRGSVGKTIGAIAAAGYLVIGALAAIKLVHGLGGLSYMLKNQAAVPSQIKELGLGPLYGATYLWVTACLLLAFRAAAARNVARSAFWIILTVALSAFLGRRIMILFVGVPIIAFVHYRRVTLKPLHVAILGVIGGAAFIAILLARLRASNSVFETVGTSLEFALYDMLVACVSRAEDLRQFGLHYFLRHRDEFWGTNTGALFLKQLSGYRFEGGAVPPTAVGALWVYFGMLGVIGGGLLGGYVLSRLRHGARRDDVCALLYGYLLFQWFGFLRNGDIVLGFKLTLRFGLMLLILILCFYRVAIVTRPNADDRLIPTPLEALP